MVRTDLLRESMDRSGVTQAQVASRLGMTTRTFYRRMKLGVFRSDEMEAMVELLQLSDPMAVFFDRAGEERSAAHGRTV